MQSLHNDDDDYLVLYSYLYRLYKGKKTHIHTHKHTVRCVKNDDDVM